jgi:hypothetical protein
VKEKNAGFEKFWASVVREYTKSLLTKRSDKLIALSGVAKIFEERYGGQYLFGIWREHLPQALLWEAEAPQGTRPLPLQAPTWSWASVDGPVHSDLYTSSDFSCKIVDGTSPVNGGLITIECERLLEIIEINQDGVPRNLSHCSYNVSIGWLSKSGPWDVRCYFDHFGPDGPEIPQQIYFLDVLDLGPGSNASLGLIVETVREKRGYFRRVGRYRVGPPVYELFKEARSIPAQEIELSIYESKSMRNENGSPTYIIHLT